MRLFLVLWVCTIGYAEGLWGQKSVSFAPPWTSPFRVDKQYPHHFVNRAGQHLYVLNHTAWAYFACKDPQRVLAQVKARGASVIRVCLEGTPYFKDLGYDLWPWGGTRQAPDWTRWNEPYWAEVERRLRLAGEQGIGVDMVLYFTLRPTLAEAGRQRAYWQQCIRRLGKYSNVFCWEIMNEYIDNADFQDVAGQFFQQNDPYRHLVITSNGTTDDAVFPHCAWMDMAVVHTCTGSTEAHPLDDWYLAVARNTRQHGKPAFNNETGREGRHRNDDPIHRRKQSWLWTMAGGYWTYHSFDGCNGIEQMGTYQAPGAEFLKPLRTFWESTPFWTLSPNHTLFTPKTDKWVHTTLANEDRSTVLLYLCTRPSGQWVKADTLSLQLPSTGAYKVYYLDPAKGDTLDMQLHQQTPPLSTNKPARMAMPAFRDDLLVKILKQ